mgnify:FL=1
MMAPVLAGAAVADITPPVGVLMDGYGNRTTPSQGVHDPLAARVLVLEYESAGSPLAAALISCDLLGMHPQITAEVRRRAKEIADIPPEAVVVAATHNHAGPYGLRGGMFSRLDEDLARAFVGAVAEALKEAWRQRRPASLKVGHAVVDTVSMNRRHPEWPIDPVMRVLLVDGEDGPIASVINFACHGTVLSGANLLLSGEFPGVAARLLLEQTGAPCLWLNGACGDVNPLWVQQDFESVDRVGRILGGQALRTIGELRTAGPGQRAHNIRWDEFLEKPAPGRLVEPRLAAVYRDIDLPLRPFALDAEYAGRIAELDARSRTLPPASAERREVMAELTRLQSERWAGAWARIRGEASVQRTQVQALMLGEGLALLALPGEFFVETAEAIRAGCGIEDLFIACYANDYVGYLVPPGTYDQGGYEAGVTFCSPSAEPLVRTAALEVLRTVAYC